MSPLPGCSTWRTAQPGRLFFGLLVRQPKGLAMEPKYLVCFCYGMYRGIIDHSKSALCDIDGRKRYTYLGDHGIGTWSVIGVGALYDYRRPRRYTLYMLSIARALYDDT